MIDRRKTAIELRLKGLTYAQIGEQLGVSRQRVQQMTRPPHAIQLLIRKRANCRCEKCGVELNTGNGHVHHVGGEDYDFNDLENLQYLCISCHLKAHMEHDASSKKFEL